jgi:hypothetical protein
MPDRPMPWRSFPFGGMVNGVSLSCRGSKDRRIGQSISRSGITFRKTPQHIHWRTAP